MEKFHSLFLAIGIAILLVPLGIYVKKFSAISTSSGFRVTFNPMECYACRDCPCTVIADDEKEYKLNVNDKTICKIDYNKINEGIEKELQTMTVDMKVTEYREFYDCIKWYSEHPSSFRGAR